MQARNERTYYILIKLQNIFGTNLNLKENLNIKKLFLKKIKKKKKIKEL